MKRNVMLIYLIDWLEGQFGHIPGAGLFRYITFRAGIAVILSLIISMMLAGGRSVEGNRYLGEDGDAQPHRQPQGAAGKKAGA